MTTNSSALIREIPFLPEKQIEREAQVLIEAFELKFETKVAAPIPVDEIVELHLQLVLEFKDMKSLFPFADVHGAIWFDEGKIGIDQSLDPDFDPRMLGRYHFTLAHEVGHWLLHRTHYIHNPNQSMLFDDGSRMPDVVCRSSQRRIPVEWQADTFAANLLMPRKMVFDAWSEFRDGDDQAVELREIRPQFAGQPLYCRGELAITEREKDNAMKEEFCGPLAERFEVSQEAMRIRLEVLELFVENRPAMLF